MPLLCMLESSLSKKSEKWLKLKSWPVSGPDRENLKNCVTQNTIVIIYRIRRGEENYLEKSEEVKLVWWSRNEQWELAIETDDYKTLSSSQTSLLLYKS